jgi:hypothetical protein
LPPAVGRHCVLLAALDPAVAKHRVDRVHEADDVVLALLFA